VKKQSYLDWTKNRRAHDLNILRQLIINSSSWKVDIAKLDEALFEKTYHLKALSNKAVTPLLLDKALNYDRVMVEITTRMRPIRPIGTTVREQVRSLLPKKLGKNERESLSYALSRIVVERVPREKKWPVVMIGLDSLTAAILSIYNISRIVNQQVPWLFSLWFYKIEQIKIEAIEHILDALTGEFTWQDVTTKIEEADSLINEALGQDPNLDSSFVQPDPLSRKILDLLRGAELKFSDEEKRRREFRTSISEELAILKGFSAFLEEEIDVRSASATRFDVRAIRADGPAASKYEDLLQLLRREINVLRYDPLVKLCLQFSKQDQPKRFTAKDLEQVSQFKGRTAYYELEKLEQIFYERYIPSLRNIGLRYRYIFTPRQRPGVVSDGLIERISILTPREKKKKKGKTAEPAEPDIRGCSIHIEPTWTKGPNIRMFPKGSFEAVVEDEIVSMRLDAFNPEKLEWVLKAPKDSRKTKRVIVQSTSSTDSRHFTLTERQLELLSILWGYEGSRTQRKWLLDQINYPIRTANRMLHQMLQNQVLKLIYLPALEFCGLPDGLMIVANCFDRRSRDALISQLTEKLPYVRLLFGDSNDVVAHARLPAKSSDIVAGPIRKMMKELSDSSFTARLMSSYRYRMTALHRIKDRETKGWKDPWPI